MKKITILVTLLLMTTIAFSQKGKVKLAQSSLEKSDYKVAKEAIDAASNNDKTKDDPLTWILKAQIYSEIQSTGVASVLGIGAITDEDTFAAIEKAKSLDTEGAYKEDLAVAAQVMIDNAHNAGVIAYNEDKDFEKAVAMFEKKMALTEKFNPDAEVDPVSLVVLGSSYFELDQKEDGINYFKQALDAGYEDQGVVNTLVNYYRENEDDENYLATLKMAQEKYPNENNYKLLEIDHYIKNGQIEEKMDELLATAEKNPENIQLSLLISGIYEQQKNYEQQRSWAQKALDVDDNNFAANFNVGVAYFNQAVEFNNEMNFMTSNTSAEYTTAKTKRDELAKKAFPSFEKAYSIDPENKSVLQAMVQYYRMQGNEAEMKKFQAKLDM